MRSAYARAVAGGAALCGLSLWALTAAPALAVSLGDMADKAAADLETVPTPARHRVLHRRRGDRGLRAAQAQAARGPSPADHAGLRPHRDPHRRGPDRGPCGDQRSRRHLRPRRRGADRRPAKALRRRRVPRTRRHDGGGLGAAAQASGELHAPPGRHRRRHARLRGRLPGLSRPHPRGALHGRVPRSWSASSISPAGASTAASPLPATPSTWCLSATPTGQRRRWTGYARGPGTRRHGSASAWRTFSTSGRVGSPPFSRPRSQCSRAGPGPQC